MTVARALIAQPGLVCDDLETMQPDLWKEMSVGKSGATES